MTNTARKADLAKKIDWEKGGGLVAAVIQDSATKNVLMLGYMDRDALKITLESGKVTFFSRTRGTLWTKGESSGNFLHLQDIDLDCDGDTLLVAVRPDGPTCHKGTETCFGDAKKPPLAFLQTLAGIIRDRRKESPDKSYVAKMFRKGRTKIAQKVGEEGVEVALAHALKQKEETASEAADLMFHLLVLLEDAGLTLGDIADELEKRHKKA
jgi:phosphoribosyl-ATP pyrophosphohydrolase/phosphoribosyl-AMP cyclohydrolase